MVMDDVVRVLKEFKSYDLEKSLVDNGGIRIHLPADTRWCSHRDSSNCLLRNLPIMKKILAEGKKVKLIFI